MVDFAQQQGQGGREEAGIPGGARDGWVLVAGDGEDLGSWRRVGLGRRSEAGCFGSRGGRGFSLDFSRPCRVSWAGPSFLLHVIFFQVFFPSLLVSLSYLFSRFRIVFYSSFHILLLLLYIFLIGQCQY